MKYTKVEMLFDSSARENFISDSLHEKFKLETKTHQKPYPICWVCNKSKLHVTK